MGTLIIGAAVFCAVGMAARKIYKDRKSGKGCGLGCGSCSCCPGIKAAERSAKVREIPG